MPGFPNITDPARIAAQIVTGIGFLGGGVILREHGEVRGLTTASTIWLVAALGIGAGAGCDGQVLVAHDLLGLFDRFTPKFVKQYANLNGEMTRAFHEYIADVQSRAFPAAEHTVEMADAEWDSLLKEL